MNVHTRIALPDVQAQTDRRNVPIRGVGVKGVRIPLVIRSGVRTAPTIATFSLTVGLPAQSRGTHMSRFIELIEAQANTLDQNSFEQLVRGMLDRLQADTGTITVDFPYFCRKSAPVSGAESWLDYNISWHGQIGADGLYRFRLKVTVPATSLCPCSKEISSHGAHNQRSHITIEIEPTREFEIEEVIAIAEQASSCELFSLLKRSDEKFVTERAYENPRFVEDLVRDVALLLEDDPQVLAYSVEVENFESIHNHSAVACVIGPDDMNVHFSGQNVKSSKIIDPLVEGSYEDL